MKPDASRPCPQCAAVARPAFTARDRNRRRAEATFPYYRCENCRLVFLAEIPQDLSLHYDADYHRALTLADVRRASIPERFKMDLVRKWAPPGRLLEIGPSRGAFALLAREAGHDVTVIEMDQRCCDFMNGTLGVRAIASHDPLAVLADLGPSDVIALWHVVEHLVDPWTLLDALADRLAAGGVLVVATPNPESLGFRLLGASWPHVDAPRHTCLIPRDALAARLGRKGLRLVDTRTLDRSARSGNSFGWGAFLAHPFTNPVARRAAYLLGCAFSVPMMLVENGRRSSAYTAVFRK